ncbi:MAG TPA: hypothetical protein VKH45_09770 [Candidatus Acidoferrum sp.]|nr:hypothetical protein [Candidatus Acidoferrum sp.]
MNDMPGLCVHSPCEDVDHASLPKANAALSQITVTRRQFNARHVYADEVANPDFS